MKLKYILKEFQDKLKGGLADKIDLSTLDQKQLLKGIMVEFEHTNDILTALEISADHIVEKENYYDELEKMEEEE
jgi:hypothetical protein